MENNSKVQRRIDHNKTWIIKKEEKKKKKRKKEKKKKEKKKREKKKKRGDGRENSNSKLYLQGL